LIDWQAVSFLVVFRSEVKVEVEITFVGKKKKHTKDI
jgi:hypothetical protein